MDAVDRAMEMMVTPMGRLPWLAVEYAKHLGRQVGLCGEVFITAYACYAQCIEGLPSEDDLYRASEDARQWFSERHTGDGLLPAGGPLHHSPQIRS